MLNCKEVSKLVSESLDRKLPVWQRLNLWMHLGMCGVCWGFRRGLVHLHQETSQHAEQLPEDDDRQQVTLPDDARERIRRVLDSRQP